MRNWRHSTGRRSPTSLPSMLPRQRRRCHRSMRSQLAVRLGADLPQIVCEPPDIASRATAEDTIELAARYQITDGFPLSPSQELRLLNGMAERADGSWAAKRVGDFGGRQGAGKSATVIARIFGGIFLVGEQLTIYTAHEFPTANEIFLRVGAIFEAWDDLSGLVLHERKAHGDQGFEIKGPKGSELTGKRRLLFKTRTGKSGRGFAKADLLIYDEAQHLMPEHIAGSGPAKLANPRSQSWWSGSGGLAISGPAWDMRRRALLGTGGRLSYTEHTAETWEIRPDGSIVWTPPDPASVDAWYLANPGLGRWVTEEDMAEGMRELRELGPRELLCVWEPSEGDESSRPISADAWLNCQRAGSTIVANDCWAVAVSPDRKWSTLAVAGRTAGGLVHVETLHREQGTDWVLARMLELYAIKRLPVRIHKSGPEASFIAPLRERGVEVIEVSSAECAQATGQFIDLANGSQLAHLGQATLDRAVAGAVLRVGMDGAAVWSQRNSSVEITPLMAATVAMSGVSVAAGRPVFAA